MILLTNPIFYLSDVRKAKKPKWRLKRCHIETNFLAYYQHVETNILTFLQGSGQAVFPWQRVLDSNYAIEEVLINLVSDIRRIYAREHHNENEEQLVHVSAGQAILEGNLCIPKGSKGIVLFAHGSGSSRHSPRNKYAVEVLHNAGIATLFVDLLS